MVTLWCLGASLIGLPLNRDLKDEREGSHMDAIDEEQSRGNSQCRRPLIQIKEWKEN